MTFMQMLRLHAAVERRLAGGRNVPVLARLHLLSTKLLASRLGSYLRWGFLDSYQHGGSPTYLEVEVLPLVLARNPYW